MDETSVGQIIITVSAATTASVFVLLAIRIYSGIPQFMQQWLAMRQAKSLEKAADWTRLRDLYHDHGEEIKRLNARCDHLQTEVDECRQREGEWMQRAIAAEAYVLGEGNALNEAQRILSTERQRPRDKSDG